MSSQQDTTSGEVRQEQSPQIQNSYDQDRFFKVYADIGEIFLAFISGEVFITLANRLAMFAKATFIPDSGSGNDAAAAALMGMSQSGFYQLANRRNLPRTKPGDELLYRFADITKQFDQPEPPPLDKPVRKRRTGVAQKKEPRPPRGKRQGKK